MSLKLVEEDQHIVDLLLDHGQSSTVQAGGPGYAASSPLATDRVRRVEEVLAILAVLPTEEPSPGLAGRTLQRVRSQREMEAVVRRDEENRRPGHHTSH